MSRAKDLVEKLSSLYELEDSEYADLMKTHREMHDDQDWHDYVDWVANKGNEFPDKSTILDMYVKEMGKDDDVYNKLKSFVPLM